MLYHSFTKDKPIVFLTARVHPGESPASYAMTSIIKFLTDKTDIRAKLLRKFFVFKIIPMINVDGVYRGYYRFDTSSFNLNRHYGNPNIKSQPEIYGIKKVLLTYSQERRIRYYLDLHAHVQSKGVFLFGNSLDYLQQVENCLLPKVMESNIETLQFENCVFNEKSMKSRVIFSLIFLFNRKEVICIQKKEPEESIYINVLGWFIVTQLK